ncbi:MAG: hypothetical protein ACRDHW_06190 [Ktedonobacteraceae bacterium]
MLSEVGWLVVVWLIWTAVFIVTMLLIRLTMHGQQETSANLEAHIIAAQTGQNVTDVRTAMAAEAGEEPAAGAAPTPEINWRLKMPRRPAPPPISAT